MNARNLRTTMYTIWVLSFLGIVVVTTLFSQVERASWIEGLPVKVNLVSVWVSSAMAFHFLGVHYLILTSQATRQDIAEVFATPFIYLMLMLPFLLSPIWLPIFMAFLTLIAVEYYIPDWPERMRGLLRRGQQSIRQ